MKHVCLYLHINTTLSHPFISKHKLCIVLILSVLFWDKSITSWPQIPYLDSLELLIPSAEIIGLGHHSWLLNFFISSSPNFCYFNDQSVYHTHPITNATVFMCFKINTAHLIIFQSHEIVVDVFVPCVFFHPCLKLFMVKYLSTVFQDEGVPTKQE